MMENIEQTGRPKRRQHRRRDANDVRGLDAFGIARRPHQCINCRDKQRAGEHDLAGRGEVMCHQQVVRRARGRGIAADHQQQGQSGRKGADKQHRNRGGDAKDALNFRAVDRVAGALSFECGGSVR